MNRHILGIEESIRRMTATIRQSQAGEIARSFGENPDPEVRAMGWWVLACGEKAESEPPNSQEVARRRLLTKIRAAGLVLSEQIWVWNESDTPQLIIATTPTLKRAERLATHLRGKGLHILIRREKF